MHKYNKIEILVVEFHRALCRAYRYREFMGHYCLAQFPNACCGIASDLLHCYLNDNGIERILSLGGDYNDDLKGKNSCIEGWRIMI